MPSVDAEPSRTTKAADDPLVLERLLEIEKRSQEQTCWLLGVTLVVLVALANVVLGRVNRQHEHLIDLIGGTLATFFLGSAAAIRWFRYHSAFKYVNVFVQISMVTVVIQVDAEMRSVAYALSSMPPFFYALVVGLTGLTISPTLCMVAGALAAVEFTGLYAIVLRPMTPEADFAANPIVGWEVTMMKSVVLLAMGAAAMLMAKKARAVLPEIAQRTRSEEKLRAIEREMAMAGEVQSTLIPEELEDVEGVEAVMRYLPSRQVGGDYVDFLIDAEGQALMVVADVSGKGLGAALTMAGVQASLRLLAESSGGVRELMAALNRSLCASLTNGRFVTMFLARHDRVTGRLEWVDAGHTTSLLIRAGGEVIRLEEGGPVLGVIEDAVYASGETVLGPGDLVFAYTDGLSESRRGKEFYGIERLSTFLASRRREALGGLASALLDELTAFRLGAPPGDDLTFFGLRVAET